MKFLKVFFLILSLSSLAEASGSFQIYEESFSGQDLIHSNYILDSVSPRVWIDVALFDNSGNTQRRIGVKGLFYSRSGSQVMYRDDKGNVQVCAKISFPADSHVPLFTNSGFCAITTEVRPDVVMSADGMEIHRASEDKFRIILNIK
jgi:hypothetical protein